MDPLNLSRRAQRRDSKLVYCKTCISWYWSPSIIMLSGSHRSADVTSGLQSSRRRWRFIVCISHLTWNSISPTSPTTRAAFHPMPVSSVGATAGAIAAVAAGVTASRVASKINSSPPRTIPRRTSPTPALYSPRSDMKTRRPISAHASSPSHSAGSITDKLAALEQRVTQSQVIIDITYLWCKLSSFYGECLYC